MMGMNNALYSTLFPFRRKPQTIEDVSLTDEPDIPQGGGGFFDWSASQQDEMALPEALPVGANPFPENIIENLPNPQEIPAPAPSFDTTGIERRLRSPLEEAQANYNEIAATPAQKQDKWKQALWIALQGANKFFNPQDKSEMTWLGEEKKKRALAKAGGELAPLQQIENQKIKSAQEQAKMAKAQADYEATVLGNQKKIQDIGSEQAKLDYETLAKKGHITEAEAEAFSRRYGRRINPFDARKFSTRYENGVPFAVPEIGIPNAQINPTLPVRKREMEVPVTVGDSTGYSTSEKGLNMKINAEKDRVGQQIRQQQIERQEEAKQENREYQSEKERQSDLQRWQQRETARQQKLTAAQTKAAKLRPMVEANKGYAEGDALAKELAVLEGEIAGLSIAEPKPTGTVQTRKNKPQTIRAKEYTVKPKTDPLGLFGN